MAPRCHPEPGCGEKSPSGASLAKLGVRAGPQEHKELCSTLGLSMSSSSAAFDSALVESSRRRQKILAPHLCSWHEALLLLAERRARGGDSRADISRGWEQGMPWKQLSRGNETSGTLWRWMKPEPTAAFRRIFLLHHGESLQGAGTSPARNHLPIWSVVRSTS